MRQYANVDLLKEAILANWAKINIRVVRKVIDSMPNRIFEVIRSNGRKINYWLVFISCLLLSINTYIFIYKDGDNILHQTILQIVAHYFIFYI